MRNAIVTALLIGTLGACDSVPSGAVTDCKVSISPSVKTDVLFVVDNSPSMAEEQANLQTNLDAFVTALKASPVAQDFHVGVTTPDVTNFSIDTATGMPVRLTAGPGVAGALIGNVPAGTPAVLDGASPTFVSDFKARVIVGTGGTGWEQPFRAMKLALTDRIADGTNAGFLRPGARLAVVFLSDEDDCSDSGPDSGMPPVINAGPGVTVPNGNLQCHNDNADGINYKARIDAIAGYQSFLAGLIGGEVRDLVLAAAVGVDPDLRKATCGWDPSPATANNWCCGSASNSNKCAAGVSADVSFSVPGGLSGTTYCTGTAVPTTCASGCPTAYDKGDRFADLLSGFPAERALTASICSDFGTTLTQLGCMLTPQDFPLEQAPADARLLVISVQSNAATIPCTVDVAGSANEGTADVVYTPPQGGQPAKLHFQNDCQLTCGQTIDISLICAG